MAVAVVGDWGGVRTLFEVTTVVFGVGAGGRWR